MKRTILSLLAVGMLIPCGAWAQDDEDTAGRGVARISLIDGDVSVRRGDSGEWVAAAPNAPLLASDHVVTGAGSRAEIQFDYGTFLRMNSDAEVGFAELENRRYQVQVARGEVTLRILRDVDSETEVDTPNISVRSAKRGTYRIAVHDDGQTEVTVRSGEVETFTPQGSEKLGAGHTMLVRGTASDPEFQVVREVTFDNWDRWNDDRDHRLERSQSYRYVSRDIYGADDLDNYGRWVNVTPYGMVWAPGGMGPGWAPYRNGRWVWVDYYGWTWVSYDPWGWAPYHYGSWFYGSYGWCWFPGPMNQRYWWRPGMVAFFGFGSGSRGGGLGFGNVGWVPLAPYERYYPWYGRRLYGGYRNGTYINNNVHIVNNTNITNIYRNARVVNGVTGVDAVSFNRGVAGTPVRASEFASRAALMRGPVPVAPIADSQRFSNRQLVTTPRSTIADQRFVTHRQPAQIERVPFQQQQRGMEQYVRHTLGDQAVQAQTGRVVQNAPGASGAGGLVHSPAVVRGGETGSVATGTRVPAATTGGRDTGVVRLPAGSTETQSGNTPGWRPTQQNEQQRGNADNNWRRFGDAGTRPQQQGAAVPSQQNSNVKVHDTEGGKNSRGWRQYNPPAPARTESAAPAHTKEQAPARVERKPESSPKNDFAPRSDGQTDWQRFPSAPQTIPSESRPVSYGTTRYDSANSQQLRINPPIVRERSSGSNSAPARTERSAPARAERSAPASAQRSAPAARTESRSSGGSHSDGGHGHNR